VNINLHIEQIILDGLPIARHEAPKVRAAIEAELARLLKLGGLDAALSTGGSFARVEAGALNLPRGGTPAQIGARIAEAVYGGFGGEAKSSGEIKRGGEVKGDGEVKGGGEVKR
jgi:hypothetical protein